MLVAHLVPGYFAAAKSQSGWAPNWTRPQQAVLWIAALVSTAMPDLDVVYNALFRGFVNHSTLWSHSLFVHVSIGLLWLILRSTKRFPYLQTLIGLIAVGGLSHLLLDMVAHNTPLFYPLSMMMVGIAPQRVISGGLWAYLTDLIFLFEPLLFGLAILHWTYQNIKPPLKEILVAVTVGGVLIFTIAFVAALPALQTAVLPLLPA